MAEVMASGKSSRKKDKKITVLVSVAKKNDSGKTIYVWEPLPGGENIWAYYRHASANEIHLAVAIETQVDVIFEVRWRNDLNTAMRIQYKGDQYHITRIDDYEGNKETLRIYANTIK